MRDYLKSQIKGTNSSKEMSYIDDSNSPYLHDVFVQFGATSFDFSIFTKLEADNIVGNQPMPPLEKS